MYGMVEHMYSPVAFHNAVMDRLQPLPCAPPPMHDPNRDWMRHARPALSDPLNLPPALRRNEYRPEYTVYKPYR